MSAGVVTLAKDDQLLDVIEQSSTSKKKGRGESKSLRTFRDAFTEALDTSGKFIHVRSDGPQVRAANVNDVKWQFNKRWATGESDPQKRSEAQRKTFDRLLKSLPPEFVTGVAGLIRLDHRKIRRPCATT
jgi:hypothetical protein